MGRIYNGRGATQTQTLREAVVTVEPLVEPVSLSEARDWLEIENFTEDDPKLKLIIKSARQWCEKWLSRSLITQTRKAYYLNYGRKIDLAHGPVQSVTSVSRIQNNVTTVLTLDSDYYVLGNEDKFLEMNTISSTVGFIYPRDNLSRENLEVEYVVGYGDDKENVPEPIRHAMLMLIQDGYEVRGGLTGSPVTKVPKDALTLLKAYKKQVVF